MAPKTAATFFVEKSSWIHRLHPFTKLSFIVLTCIVAYVGPAGWVWLCLSMLVNMLAVISGGMSRETCKFIGRILLPLMMFMIPIHGFLYPENQTVLLVVIGFPFYWEGLMFSLATLAKLSTVLLASLLFVFSTHPADLIVAISGAVRSASLAYLFGSPLFLLAAMRARIDTIQAVQRARGLDTDGNVLQRVRCLAPLIRPLIVGAIVEVEQRSIALEIRGFRSTSAKTSVHLIADSILQRLARWLMLIVALGLIFIRLVR